MNELSATSKIVNNRFISLEKTTNLKRGETFLGHTSSTSKAHSILRLTSHQGNILNYSPSQYHSGRNIYWYVKRLIVVSVNYKLFFYHRDRNFIYHAVLINNHVLPFFSGQCLFVCVKLINYLWNHICTVSWSFCGILGIIDVYSLT